MHSTAWRETVLLSHYKSPLLILPLYPPLSSPVAVLPCFCRGQQAGHWLGGLLSHQGETDQLKAKNSLMKYWSGIVRQAEMTKFTQEQSGSLLFLFSVITSAGRSDVSISQELHGLVITHGEMRSYGHQSCQDTCSMAATLMELSSPQYHINMLYIMFKKGTLSFIWHFTDWLMKTWAEINRIWATVKDKWYRYCSSSSLLWRNSYIG